MKIAHAKVPSILARQQNTNATQHESTYALQAASELLLQAMRMRCYTPDINIQAMRLLRQANPEIQDWLRALLDAAND